MGDDFEHGVSSRDDIARMQLPAAPRLALAVHEHLLVLEKVARLAAGVDDVCELQELSQPDRRAPNRDLAPVGHFWESDAIIAGSYRHQLPQLSGERAFVTDGGLETDLIFNRTVDLPEFAAFPLLDDAVGMREVRAYYEGFLTVAREHRAGFILDTPTWRANRDWGDRLGSGRAALADFNVRWVEAMAEMGSTWDGAAPIVLDGIVGPRGDGYVSDDRMSVDEAADYHAEQIATFARSPVDMVTVLTLNYAEEAVGIARAAAGYGVPVVVSFTLETDGRLPSGQELGEAIEQVDSDSGTAPAYFMVNCAHPTHFEHVLARAEPWRERIRGIRANASRMSHAELGAAEGLDAGDPAELAGGYERLRAHLPNLTVLGGCCGTDSRHVAAICDRLL